MVVILDLISAYNIIWERGLLLKLAKILKCKTYVQLIDSILSDRKLKVFTSKRKRKHV